MKAKKVAKKVAKKSAKKKLAAASTEKNPNSDQCDACKFYKQIDSLEGSCRRYPFKPGTPMHPTISATEWCGEFTK